MNALSRLSVTASVLALLVAAAAHASVYIYPNFSEPIRFGDTIHAVCTALTEPDYPVSPTRFSNSVHNAPAGYWSIAAKVRRLRSSMLGKRARYFSMDSRGACTALNGR